MLSESARMTMAAEARYRIPYPNSKSRAVKVIALDTPSAALLVELSKRPWKGAQLFTAAASNKEKSFGGEQLKGGLNDLAGRPLDLVDEVAHSDFIVVVAFTDAGSQSVSVLAEVCKLHHKALIGLIVPRPDASEEAIVASLKHLRPYTGMLVVTHGSDYVEAMLTALRA